MLQWISSKIANKKITVALGGLCAVVFCILAILGGPTPVRAQGVASPDSNLNQGLTVIKQPLGLPTTDLRLIIANVIRVALGLLGIIFLIIILYGGYLWMTAGGNEEQVGTAKNVLKNGVIGLAIVLSAYAIVLFVMRLLGINGGGLLGGSLGTPDGSQNFVGSGGLGTVIKDHYPERDQTGVARNTKIIITFKQPVLASSLIDDTNGDGVLGDCKNTTSTGFDWSGSYCDQLKLDVAHINITQADTGASISGAAALAAFDENGKMDTIVIRPLKYLGSDTAHIAYKVHVGASVQLDDSANDNPGIFAGRGMPYYEWTFTCSTQLDLLPPHVVSVYPDKNYDESNPAPKNSVIQIDFNKPMDPTGIQGSFIPDSVHTGAAASIGITGNLPPAGVDSFVYLNTQNSNLPAGFFRLTNGYRTLEFTPSTACGTNACGGTVYCLSVCNAQNTSCTQDAYNMLVKAATTISASSFEAVPFSGVADIDGNALDGNNNGVINVASSTPPVFPNEVTYDNYFWTFVVGDKLDLTAPYLSAVQPIINGQDITPAATVKMEFTKRMQVEPMYTIGIDEKAADGSTVGEPLCHAPRVSFVPNSSSVNGYYTETTINHCPFLNAKNHYYYPNLDSRVEDVNFNCFFPGQGPGGGNGLDSSYETQGLSDENPLYYSAGNIDCDVTTTYGGKTFCCNGLATSDTLSSCSGNLKAISN